MTRRRRFLENMTSLMVVQFANYVIPLVSFPYLVRMLGVGNFGLMSYAMALVQYFVVFVDYGFNLSATRRIAIQRDDRRQLAATFWTVMTIKLCLLIVGFAVFATLVMLVPRLRLDWLTYAIAFVAVVGNFLFPIWYFQGIERIKILSLINLATKIVFTASLLLLVKGPDDLHTAILLQSSSVIFSGLVALGLIARLYPVPWHLPTVAEISALLLEGWVVFVSILSSSLVNNTGVIILGMFANNQAVGAFSIAEKIIRIFINVCTPISTALFPQASALFEQSTDQAVAVMRTVLRYGAVLFGMICAAILVGADVLVRIVAGGDNPAIATMVRIMALTPLTVFIDNLYGTQVLINIGQARKFMTAIIAAGIVSVSAALLVVPFWKGMGTAAVFMVSEGCVLVLMVAFVRQQGIFLVKDGWV